MSKTPKQKEKTAQVQERLVGPVRVDASAVTSGQSGGAKQATSKTLHGIHPSLEGAVTELAEGGFKGGQITTPSGMSVQVVKGPRSKEYLPHGQGMAPQRGKEPLPPVQEGVSQRFETRIGRERGEEKSAELTAEADAVATRVNPLRSDGIVDGVMNLHAPSVGGNQHGHGGRYSALAKMDDQRLPQSPLPSRDVHPGSNVSGATRRLLGNGPAFQGGKDLALNALGYNDAVQTAMLGTARDRITRRQGRGRAPALSQAEIHARAYGQVNEALDEALHGTKQIGKDRTINAVISELGEQQEGGGQGFSVKRDSPEEGAGQSRLGPAAAAGPGMTKSRTPNQRAQRAAVRALVTQGTYTREKGEGKSFAARSRGGWSALKDADAHTAAAKNDLEELTLRQKARAAMESSPEERLTDSPGSAPEQKSRGNRQPVFSTGKAAPYADTAQPGVGVFKASPGERVLPPQKREGAVAPTPPNLPEGPARIGRTREERGLGPRDYGTAIADYEASRPKATPKNTGKPRSVSAVPATESNVDVAQTKVSGTLDTTGLAAAKKQNPALGQRAPQGARSKRPTVR